MTKKHNEDFENVLQDPELSPELGPDEMAVHTAGLTHPDDLALERILAEDWDSVPDHQEEAMTPEEALNQFLYGEEDDASAEEAVQEETEIQEQPESQEPVAEEEFEESDFEEDTPADTTPLPKGRPKMKKGYGLLGIPHLIATVIWLAITLAIGVSLGRVLWVCCADMMAFGKPQVTAYITVTEDDDIEAVSQKLADAGLVRYSGLFQKFAEITKKSERINAGVYELGSHLDYNAMLNNMIYSSDSREIVEITFPEGYTCAQTFRLLEEKGVCSAAELEEWAVNGELSEYWFLENIERGSKYCLEGYL